MPALVGQNAASLLGGSAGNWRSQIRRGAYVSPSGTRHEFESGDVSESWDYLGTVFEFPRYGRSFVQRMGKTDRRRPVVCFFSGADHHEKARAFTDALDEEGVGRLEHPFYGTSDVIPFGQVARRDDLASGKNQSAFEVVFFLTLESVYPRIALGVGDIEGAIGAFNSSLASGLGAVADLDNAAKQAGLAGALKEMFAGLGSAFDTASDLVSDVRASFSDVVSVANLAIDTFIGKPLDLANQISNLIQAPARALDGLSSRIDGYVVFAESIFGSTHGNPSASIAVGATQTWRRTQIANAFHGADMMAMSAVSGAALSADGNVARTRPEALAAVAEIEALLAATVAWRDEGFDALQGLSETGRDQTDDGGAFRDLREAVARASTHLTTISYSLPPERSIVLDRGQTLIELASTLYRSTDDSVLDDLVGSNDLSAEDFFNLEAGRRIIYVQR